MKHYHGNKIMEQKFPARKFSGFILSFFFIFRNKICELQTFCIPKMIWMVVTMCARTEWFIWCCPVQENKDSNGGVSAWRCSKESSERTIARVPSSPVHLYIRSTPVRFQWLIRRSRYPLQLCRRMRADLQSAVLKRLSYRRQNLSRSIPRGSVRLRAAPGRGRGPGRGRSGSASFRSGFFCPAGDGSGSHGGGCGAAEALGRAGAAAGLPRLRGAGGRRAAGAGKAGRGAGGSAAPPAALGAARQPHLPAGARPAEAHPGELRAVRASARIRASPRRRCPRRSCGVCWFVGGGSCGGYVGWMAGSSGLLLN